MFGKEKETQERQEKNSIPVEKVKVNKSKKTDGRMTKINGSFFCDNKFYVGEIPTEYFEEYLSIKNGVG
jgi:hypothetical protein